MHPDNPDSKMLAKATKVLQEHVKDVSEKTKNNCCVGTKNLQKENMVIPNYNSNDPSSLNYIVDNNSGTTYLRGKLLGKGGFAKCYELVDVKTNKTYAGKIISKSRLTKPHQKEKIAREIDLHRNLKHKNVVGFHSYFEDDNNVYIVLEICNRKSLVHVLKSRKTLTEPEVRFYLHHLVNGTRYVHKEKIIHRDLKLGNMLLNDKMEVKIADFGLATRVQYPGEKKMTVCGTPNYIAPEVLQKKGHSYEADVWAMGCVLYALLVGRPPFETATLKETYMRITANKYFVPPNISKPAKHLIQKLLHPDPEQRPSLDKILSDEFFSSGYMPKNLPTSCCDSTPKWPSNSHVPQRPKSYAAPVSPSEAMHKITNSLAQWKGSKKASSQILAHQPTKDDMQVPPAANDIRDANSPTPAPSVISEPARKSSRDRSPHHHHNHHHNNQSNHLHSRSRSTDNNKRRSHSERSKSPPKSPRQVIIETKPVDPKVNYREANNNLINHAHLKGYHPGMVLCSGGKNGGKVYSPSTGNITTTATTSQHHQQESNPALSTPSLISSPVNSSNKSTVQSCTDGKGLPAGSAIRLYQLLSTCLDQMPGDANPTPVTDAKPLWVTKWVDYSNKYGFGFQLSDKSVGVLFNDTTRMLLAPDGRTIQYNDLSNRVFTFTTETAPAEHQKKSTLLLYFAQYMGEHLIHGGDLLEHKVGEATAIFMKKWFRTGKAIVMYLNNGTLQVNFFDDHTKVILSPEGQDYLITYINSSRQALSFRLLQFRHFGCKPDIVDRLTYARKMLESIINIEGETV